MKQITQPGYYWIYSSTGNAEPCEVYKSPVNAEWLVRRLGTTSLVPLSEFHETVKFEGPILPPN